MRNRKWLGALLVAAVVLSGNSAEATLVAGNFGPGDSYQHGTGNSWAVGYGSFPTNLDYVSEAVSFTNSSSTAYSLDEFRFAANYFRGDNLLEASVYGGSSDINSASLLESFSFTAPTQFDDYIYTASSILHPILAPGQTYFIVLNVPQTPDNLWGWQWNDQGQNGYFGRFNSDPWFEAGGMTPVFDVSGTAIAAVPEPSSLALIGLTMGGMGVYRRRRRTSMS